MDKFSCEKIRMKALRKYTAAQTAVKMCQAAWYNLGGILDWFRNSRDPRPGFSNSAKIWIKGRRKTNEPKNSSAQSIFSMAAEAR